ncbi:MAG: DUF4411 family protein [Alcanivoracaceae bacterium]|nr:DUF4411 family protein [Alcanivoracaceae bacterium]
MPVIDASSVVHAWDNYPIENFPKFWDWLDGQFSSGGILIPSVAYTEVGHVSPDCHAWLKSKSIKKVGIDNVIARNAMKIKAALGIADDNYGSGVDENDIIIISTAKTKRTSLVSNEQRQPTLPPQMKRYKIPAVCSLRSVNVTCESLAEHIRQSRQVF